jgi:hypothetical protein
LTAEVRKTAEQVVAAVNMYQSLAYALDSFNILIALHLHLRVLPALQGLENCLTNYPADGEKVLGVKVSAKSL